MSVQAKPRTAGVAQPMLDHLRSLIDSGTVQQDEQLGTEVELAESFGINRMTVRRALDDLVDQGLIERRRGKGIFLARPHLISRTIQLVAPNVEHEAIGRVVRGLQEHAREQGYAIQTLDAHGDLETTIRMLRQLSTGRACGAIFRSLHDPRCIDAVLELQRSRFPFVMLDQRLEHSLTSSVTTDNYGGGYAAAESLLALGHQRFAFIGLLSAQTNIRRWAGVRDAVNDAGIAFNRHWGIDLQVPDPLGDWTPQIEEATERVLQAEDRPTAIFYNDDRSAAIGLRYLQERQVEVPTELSIVGSGATSFAALMRPKLATLDAHHVRQGEEAMDLLTHLLANPDAEPEHRVVPMTWLPGESIGPAPKR